jgi:hypothetical protein
MRGSRLGLACLLVATSVALGAGPAMGSSAAAGEITPGGLDSLAVSADGLAENSDDFIDLAVDQSAHGIDLYVTNSHSPLVTAVQALLPSSVRLVVTAGRQSRRSLDLRTDAAAGAVSKLRAAGVEVSRYGPTFGTGEFEVGLHHPTTASIDAVKSALGADVQVVDTTPEVQASPYTRLNDGPVFKGGNFRTNQNQSKFCTSGFSVRGLSSGNDYDTWAGHCGNLNDVLYEGTNNTYGEGLGSHRFVGTVFRTGYNDSAWGYVDAGMVALYSQNSNSNQIWGDNSGVHHVTSVAHPLVGTTICVSGAYDGEACGPVASTNYNQCQVYTDGATACHVVQAGPVSSRANDFAGSGDSGAPVYYYSASSSPAPNGANVTAVGLLSAGIGGSTSNCVVYALNFRMCSDYIFVTDIAYVQTTYGVAVKTS